jgi:hypothetical protein
MTASTPGVVNADAQLQARRLKAIVSSARLLGLAFLGFGLLAMLPAIDRLRFDPLPMLIASSLTSSGALYVVFAVFLRKRRYWAWVATLVMTILLLGAVALFTVFVVSNIAGEFTRWGDPQWSEMLLMLLGPGLWLGCWMAALILILRYLGQSLPAVREEEAVAQKGFAVIPVADLAPPAHDG